MRDKRPQLNKALFIVLLFFLIVPAFIYSSWINYEQRKWDDLQLLKTATKPHRGTYSERSFVLQLLKKGFHPKAIFHDIYVKKQDGNYTQIDLVLATKVGLLAIEIKDYAGRIYGKGNQKYWTQVLSYGRIKHRFYNPVMQNANHIVHLKKLLAKEKVPIFNVIIFYGNSSFYGVSEIPNGVFCVKDYQALKAIDFIINNNPLAHYTDKHEVVSILNETVANGDETYCTFSCKLCK
ncbi:MAG: NERD domain-containing protein [Firmicutes bacterium]|nr:NERD domain-containing protein [Bacillota bacterium]